MTQQLQFIGGLVIVPEGMGTVTMSPSVFEDGVVWGNGEGEPGGEMVMGGVGQPEVWVTVADFGENGGEGGVGVAVEMFGEGETLVFGPIVGEGEGVE